MVVIKFLRIHLRFLAVFLLFITFNYSHAQDLSKKISLKLKNSTLTEVINEISRLGQINFSYSPQVIPAYKIVSVKAKNKTISEILNEVLKENNIDYNIIENQVVLTLANNNPNYDHTRKDSLNSIKKQAFSLYGFVREKSTGEVLIGAVVYVKGTCTGTITNSYGFYSLTLPEGIYNIVISYMGFNNIYQTIDLKKNQKISFDLDFLKIELNEVKVLPGDFESDIMSNQLSDMKLTTSILSRLPGFVGEIDIIKSLEVIPGVNAYGDGSSFFYVRGGNSDQNLLLIDDAPIYNPSHLFGFFTVLAPDAVKDVVIYKGDFPSNYGGRLSSVIDIKMKDGNMRNFVLSGSIGPYTSNLSVEGPVIKDKCSFFLSGRRSNLEWLKMTNIFSNSLSLVFYDLNAKLNYKFNDNNRFILSFYKGKDDFSRATASNDSYGITWNNLVSTFRWNHIYNKKLFSNTTFYSSDYNYYLYISKGLNDYWKSSISNISCKSDYTYYLNIKNTVKSGIEISKHSFNPGNVHFSDENLQNNAPSISKYNSHEFDFYINDEISLSKKLSVRFGIRLPVWQDLGKTAVFKYNADYNVIDTIQFDKNEAYTTFVRFEPRFNIKYSLNNFSSVKASYNRTTQFIQLLTNSTSPFTSLEVWVPSGPNIKPQYADQYSLGYFNQLPASKLYFSIEAFYKKFNNVIDYTDHANMLYNPLIEGELRFGNAWSYGAEFMLRKNEGKLTGWIGYTYSRSLKKIENVNNGKSYPAFYDRPHNICINLAYNTEKQLSVSANWFFISGAAITTPVGFFYNNGYSIPLYGEKNNDRLPVYHRLDLSLTYKFNTIGKRFRHTLTFTLYNAYNQDNIMSVNFNKKLIENDRYVVPSNLSESNELVPTTISVIGMIPSLTYNFKF
jgi:outer membrane receptor for ferrienterochelin and colicin